VSKLLSPGHAQSYFVAESTFGGTGEGGDSTVLPLDAIQELGVVTNPKAEYGWIPGVTNNIGIKAGTNNLHGDVYAYGRSSSFDGRNAFAAQRNPLSFEQFGGTLGGPLKKDKLFYFMAYEGFRESLTSVVTETPPVLTSGANANTGLSIPDAIADIINKHNGATATAGTTVLNNLSLNIAGCDPSKIPTTGTTNTGASIVATGACNANHFGAQGLWNNPNIGVIPNEGHSDNGLVKIDYHISGLANCHLVASRLPLGRPWRVSSRRCALPHTRSAL
jgi:hypothetical protein